MSVRIIILLGRTEERWHEQVDRLGRSVHGFLERSGFGKCKRRGEFRQV
jgi:hypothetical protein